jgi:glycosyltransferase involved in cell wall biosynthesis
MQSAIPIIHHGVAVQFSPSNVHRENFLLAVGDIYIQKNFHSLIEAFAELSPRFPTLELRIAGRMIDQHYGERIKSIIKREGLEEKVKFLGHVSTGDLIDLYQRCRVFVFPSLAESFGMPILEAMACGAPCVVSNRSAMPEVAGPAGLHVDPEDTHQIAREIEKIIADNSVSDTLSQKGLTWTHSKRWGDVGLKTADFLATLI